MGVASLERSPRGCCSRAANCRALHTRTRASHDNMRTRARTHTPSRHTPPRPCLGGCARRPRRLGQRRRPSPSPNPAAATRRRPPESRLPPPPTQPLLHSTHVHALLRPFPAPTRPRAPHLWEADRARRARAVCRASSHVRGNAQPPHTRRKRTQNSHHGQPFTLMAPKQSDPETETRHAGGGRRSAWAGGSECWLTTYYRKPRRAMRVTGSLRRRPRR